MGILLHNFLLNPPKAHNLYFRIFYPCLIMFTVKLLVAFFA